MVCHHNFQLLSTGKKNLRENRFPGNHMGFVKISSAIKILVLSGLFVLSQAADLLLIKDVDKIKILDKYEQPYGNRNNQKIAILKVLKENATLGDQISPAMKVEMHGEVCYLPKDEKGGLSTVVTNNSYGYFRNCTHIGDTIQIVKPGLIINSQYPSGGKQFALQVGDRFLRLFQYQKSYFLQKLGAPDVYGWSSIEIPHYISKIKFTAQSDTLYPELQKRIEIYLDSVSQVYKSYFGYFNSVTKQDRSIPRWEYRKDSPSSLVCTMKGVPVGFQLDASTSQLVLAINNLLIATEFVAVRSDNKIIIQPKN